MTAAAELAEIDALRAQLRTYLADTSFTEEYQLTNGVRVRRGNLKSLCQYYDQRHDQLSSRVSRASSPRVRVGSFSPAVGIDR